MKRRSARIRVDAVRIVGICTDHNRHLGLESVMEGKIALEEHFSTPMNNGLWDSKGEESRNSVAYTRASNVAHRLAPWRSTMKRLTERSASGVLRRGESATRSAVANATSPSCESATYGERRIQYEKIRA